MRQMIEIKDENKSPGGLNITEHFSNILILHHIISYHIMQGNRRAGKRAGRQPVRQTRRQVNMQEQSYLMRHRSWWWKFFLFFH